LPVTWKLPPATVWKRPGTVPVKGVATDALGRTHRARATVAVDTLVSTLPGRGKTFTGGRPALPATVTALGRYGAKVERPVVWQAPPAGAFDAVGVVTIAGRADAGPGRTLPATVRVQVTRPIEADAPSTGVTATFTEPGYSPAGLRNGILTDKAWSNWQSGPKNAGDTLTVALAGPQAVTRVVTHFYRDGSDSYARSLQVQARDARGGWADAGDPVTVPAGTATAPVVDVAAPATTDAIRVVLNAHPDRHMTVSEIQVFAAAPGTSSDPAAAAIALDGTALPGFTPDRTSYAVRARGKLPTVTAVAADPYATVAVRQATARDRTATVTVTSEDRSQQRRYTISLRK
jgi:hypothetical protein